jgi:predicted dienelactone hydrolase
LALAVILMCFGNADAAEHAYQMGATKLVVRSEPRGANAPSPVIIFSHGFHGRATQSRFLMNAFAAAGYIVFAPNHRDGTCGGGQSRWRDRSQDSFTHPAEWTDQSYKDRAEDIRRVIEIIRSDERFRDSR